MATVGKISGVARGMLSKHKSSEAEFLDVTGTKILKSFPTGL
jgi:hypothetical protein